MPLPKSKTTFLKNISIYSYKYLYIVWPQPQDIH